MHVRRDVFDTSLFGTPDQVGLVRGLAEIRARRPVLVTSNSETVLALPIDGVDSSRLTAFKKLCSPHTTKIDSFRAKSALAGLSNFGADGVHSRRQNRR